jgi:hypothetical protein
MTLIGSTSIPMNGSDLATAYKHSPEVQNLMGSSFSCAST